MNPVETSGGLAAGRHNGPQLDILPIPPTRFGDPLAVLRKALRSEPLTWQKATGPLMSMFPRDWVGIVGVSVRQQISLRFAWPSRQSPTEALRDIENAEAESGAMPAATADVIAAALVAARGIPQRGSEWVSPAVMAMAMLVDRFCVEPHVQQGIDQVKPLSSKEIESVVARLAPGELRINKVSRPTDAARIMLEFARHLWSHEMIQWKGWFNVDRYDRMGLSTIASVDALTRPYPAVEVSGVKLSFTPESALQAWPQTVVMLTEHIMPDTVRSLAPDGAFPPEGLLPFRDVQSGEHLDIMSGLAANLVREAAERAIYVPIGSFRLDIPSELAPLREAGVESLSIVVDAAGMWVRVRGQDAGGIFRWEPKRGILKLTAHPNFAAWMNVVLAALWHDLRCAGEGAVCPAGESTNPRAAATLQRDDRPLPPHPRKPQSARVLPALRLSGRRQWGTPQEREFISRRAHGVRGHLRRLQAGWKHSQDAVEIASTFGVIIPDAFTFVRPHVRGQADENTGETASLPDGVVVRSRGLASVISLLVD